MKRAIKTHRIDFVAIFVLVLAAFGVTLYILEHQPAFNFGRSYYVVKAEFAQASAVTSGQGQAVTIAGVPVGQIGTVTLQDGHAVVTMDIKKQYAPIYHNATVLLRPRTPLKDMYLELDPGTRSAGKVPAGGTLSTANTTPDVDVSEILSSLDSDSRNYLVLLLASAAGIFRGQGQSSGSAPNAQAVASLQETLKRFGPLDRDAKRFTSLLATRQADLKASVHNLDLVAGALGGVDSQLASLIRASDQNFRAIANNDSELQSTLQQFPGTLRQTTQTLGKVRTFASATGSALHKLQPFAKNLAPALKAARPLFADTTPVIKHELRPFSVALQPLASKLEPAAADLKTTAPELSKSVGVLNSLFNELAYQGKGESRSYLFYGGWLAHITDSLVSNQDANGAVLQGLFMGDCASLVFYEGQLEPNNQPLGVLLDLLNPPALSSIPGVKTIPTAPGQAPLYSCTTGSGS